MGSMPADVLYGMEVSEVISQLAAEAELVIPLYNVMEITGLATIGINTTLAVEDLKDPTGGTPLATAALAIPEMIIPAETITTETATIEQKSTQTRIARDQTTLSIVEGTTREELSLTPTAEPTKD